MDIKEEAFHLRHTVLEDKKRGVTYEVDTCQLRVLLYGSFVARLDAYCNNTGGGNYETMVATNGHWWNFTQMRFRTAKQALAWHVKCVQIVARGDLATIRSNQIPESHPLWDLEDLDGIA